MTSHFLVPPFTFISLVNSRLRMVADLHITLLRPEEPGGIVTRGGDIDNRIKTLFDALRMPKGLDELPSGDVPGTDEQPFHCLLEDDNLITSVHVQTERLLEASVHRNEVILLIRVKTKLTETLMGNIGLGS